MRVTRDQIVTLMEVVWCNDTACYRPIWERACANLIFKCVMLPSQKLGSNQDVLRLVMLVATTPLKLEDAHFVLPEQSPESREVMHAIVVQTG